MMDSSDDYEKKRPRNNHKFFALATMLSFFILSILSSFTVFIALFISPDLFFLVFAVQLMISAALGVIMLGIRALCRM